MKKLLAALALSLFTISAAWAQDMGDDGPEPPSYHSPCKVWLGDAVLINGLWYVPVWADNPYLVNIRNLWGWGDAPDIELTGTLRPANGNAHLQGHLGGNYWSFFTSASLRSPSGELDPADGLFSLDVYGAWQLPPWGPADCSSLPYPEPTTAVLCYLHLVGEGTVRFARNFMFSGDVCAAPAISYLEYAVIHRTVQFPGTEPPGGGGGGTCGGDPNCIEGLTAGTEGAPKKDAKAAVKRSTWASIKRLYR